MFSDPIGACSREISGKGKTDNKRISVSSEVRKVQAAFAGCSGSCRIKPVPFRECARDGDFFCRPGGFFQAGGATFLKELKGEHRTKEDLPSIEQTLTASSIHSDNGGGAALSAIVLLAFTPSMNACSTTAPAETGGAETSRITESASFGTLQIVIDWSGSCVQPVLEEAWNTVKHELPSIIEANRIGALSIASFDEDGWSPRPWTEVKLPVFNLPERPKQQATEWDSFANIRDAVRDAEEGEWLKKKTAAQDQFRRNLRDALAPIDSPTALPEPARQSKRTDIVGLFKPISENQSEHPPANAGNPRPGSLSCAIFQGIWRDT